MLRNLEWLDLTGNDITNFKFLDSLKNLQYFYYLDLEDLLYNLDLNLIISILLGEEINWEKFLQQGIWDLNRPYVQEYAINEYNNLFSYMFDYIDIEELNNMVLMLNVLQMLGVNTLGELIDFVYSLQYEDFDLEFLELFEFLF